MDFSMLSRSLQPSATLQLTAKAAELKRQGRNIISLSAGQPDFPSPKAAIDAAIKAMEKGQTVYTATPGIPELREAVAASTSRRRGVQWKASNVLVSCGAKHSIANLLLAVVDPGQKILVQRPYWVSYPEMVKLAGGVPIFPEGRTPLLDAKEIDRAVAAGAKGVILNSPSNPTGLVYGAERMAGIAAAVQDAGIWVISDDIYEDLVYLDKPAPHILDFAPSLADRTAVVSGVSKTFAMTGWRIGWAVAPEEWIRMAIRIQEHTTSNPTSIAQWASLAVVTGGAEEERMSMHSSFRRRRDLMCDLLSEVPLLGFQKPEGAFYVFPEIKGFSGSSSALCARLLEEEGLAVIPGDAFGEEGSIRLSFAASDDDIQEGVRRLKVFLAKGSVPE
jgi:aspartate aminotransferase